MKIKSESYPNRIRRIAEDLSKIRNIHGMAHSVEKLRIIANEIEENLKKALQKKPD